MNSRLATLLVVGLFVLGTVGGVASPAAADSTATNQSPPSDTYVVEQDDSCYEIEPLSSEQSIEAFYDYRDHNTHPNDTDRMYSSYGTTHLQESDTSLLFLHEGTDGTSLVMVHDELDGGTAGGVVEFDLVGAPHAATWDVRNDDYDGDTNRDEFDRGDGYANASWAYIEDRTGGGALNGGFGGPFSVTVHPAFNEDTDLYDADVAEEFEDENVTGTGGDWWDGGEIDDWEALSGDVDDPDRHSLSLSEPVTVRTGSCDDPGVTYDRTDGGIAASVSAPSVDDRVPLQPTAGTGDGVQFERIDVTGLEDDTTLEFASETPDGPPESPAGTDAMSHLSVDGDASTDASGTVTFTVSADELDDPGIGPDDVVLYEAVDDEWNETTTEVRADRGGSYQFEAEVSSLEGLTVALHPEAGPDERSWVSDVGFAGGVAVGSFLLLSLLWVAAVWRR